MTRLEEFWLWSFCIVLMLKRKEEITYYQLNTLYYTCANICPCSELSCRWRTTAADNNKNIIKYIIYIYGKFIYFDQYDLTGNGMTICVCVCVSPRAYLLLIMGLIAAIKRLDNNFHTPHFLSTLKWLITVNDTVFKSLTHCHLLYS